MTENMKKSAVDEVFHLLVGLPVWALSENFHDIMVNKGKDRCREERFFDHIFDLYRKYESGEITTDDINDLLKQKCGVTIQ